MSLLPAITTILALNAAVGGDEVAGKNAIRAVPRQAHVARANELVGKVGDFNETVYHRLTRYQPRHIHLAYGENPFDIVITWSTVDNPNDSHVEFGTTSIGDRTAKGTVEEFVETGPLKLIQYIHRLTLTDLDPGQTYVYHCGSNLGWSPLFVFTAMRSGVTWFPRLAVYGDLGADNAQSLTLLQQEVQRGRYDAVLHIGDFAYDMDTDDGYVGDVFMENIEPISAYVPYMTVPGNHEKAEQFHQYKKRFSMPGRRDSMYYSWNMGPIHFIAVNTEVYFEPNETRTESVLRQYKWLEMDLQRAASAEARKEQSWIITYGHQPMYCTDLENPKCAQHTSPVRIGHPELGLIGIFSRAIPISYTPGLEDLLIRYGVDLALWAHEHTYERMLPLYDTVVYNGTVGKPYANPGGLTNIITGYAGCFVPHGPFPENMPPWAGYRTNEYGFSCIEPLNSTHLHVEQVSINQKYKVIDSFTLVRERHEAYGPFRRTTR